MSVIALRYAVLRFVESGEQSYDCVAHYGIDELSSTLGWQDGMVLQTENKAGIVSSFSRRDKSAAVAFCLRYEEDWLFGSFDIMTSVFESLEEK
jgi:hypothetical protein